MRRSLFAVLLLVAGPAWSADITLPNYERIELENGAVLLLSEKHDVPLIGLRAVIRGGSITDSENKAGLTELLATVMQKGAGSRDAAEFAAASANVGGRLSINAGVEAVIVSAEFLSRDTELLIELVADALLRPTLADAEFAKERERAIGLIRAAKDANPNNLCQPEQPDDLLRRRLPVRRPPVWQPNHRQRVIPGGD
jgi:predicted Zn-dependent peptidase